MLEYTVRDLDPLKRYHVFLDMVLVDKKPWKFQNRKWVKCGKVNIFFSTF